MEIEIPFGAKDSELTGWEYTIPEDMEAVIKDGKVIVKKKESEDERIRKAIEGIIRVYEKTQGEWIAGYDMDTLVVHLRDAFAYLEKQKEQKEKEIPKWMPKFLDELRSKKTYFDWDEHRDMEGSILAIIDFIAPDYFTEKDKKEQKPAEKQDYSGLTDFERAIHRGFLCAGVENVPVEIIKETAQDCLAHIEQKPVEWSEEEIDKVVVYLHERDGGMLWSKAKEIATDICDILRPQSHWKPSEEQMGSLRLAIDSAKKAQMYATADILNEIYEQLKKL